MKVFFIICSLLFTTLVSANPLHKIVVFGDSLSDNGNLYEYMKHQIPLSPPYFEGRFANGFIWAELLVNSYYPNDIKNHLADYAFGGAGVLETDDDDDYEVFTLQNEIYSYLTSNQGKADPNTLFIIWIGSNNYLALPENTTKATENVTLGIRHSVEKLIARGARHIMVINLPDLGRAPAAREFDAEALLSEISKKHNEKLKAHIAALEAQYPYVQLINLDINQVLGDMMNRPEEYGFTNVTDTCYEAMMNDNGHPSILKMASKLKLNAKGDACDGYLFFDPVHPSAPAHRLMAEKTRLLLDQLGVVFN